MEEDEDIMASSLAPTPRTIHTAAVTVAAATVNVVLALGMGALCGWFAVGGDHAFPRQAACALACLTYLGLLSCANLLVRDDPRMDRPAQGRQGVRTAATAYMSVTSFAVLLAVQSWIGQGFFVVSWLWTVSYSMRHLERLVGHALGGRSWFADA